jgi:hypothetical protein
VSARCRRRCCGRWKEGSGAAVDECAPLTLAYASTSASSTMAPLAAAAPPAPATHGAQAEGREASESGRGKALDGAGAV